MYNGNNNGTGDGMIDEKDTGALINQIRVVTRDHIDWIKTQLLKSGNFMVARGREVWIDVPNSKLKNIVTIPSKNEPNYRDAWARVYNLAVDYLEGCLSYACMRGELDYRTINWPEFNPENADYARQLESIWNNYKLEVARKLQEEEQKKKLTVTKSSVMLEPVSTVDIEKVYEEEIQKMEPLKVEEPTISDVVPKRAALAEPITSSEPVVQEPEANAINFQESSSVNLESNLENVSEPAEEFVAQKILDGDKLTTKDVRDLIDKGTNLVILPCQDVDNIKEEKLFFENMNVCNDENVDTGVMIYGKATDEKDATYELKKLFKLLDQCGNSFTRCVVYEVNDKFVQKNKDSEMKLLSFINAYTMIAEGLAKEGMLPIISMNLTSKKILEDIYKRYNLDSKYEIVYMVLVRELDELSKEDSTILMDPQYDYDVMTLRNPRFKNSEIIREMLESKKAINTTLAKAA